MLDYEYFSFEKLEKRLQGNYSCLKDLSGFMKMNIKEIREFKICILYVLTKLDIFHKFEDSGEGLGFRFLVISVFMLLRCSGGKE